MVGITIILNLAHIEQAINQQLVIYLTFFISFLSQQPLTSTYIFSTFAVEIPRDGAVVARWAHNPKVVSSSLAPATK